MRKFGFVLVTALLLTNLTAGEKIIVKTSLQNSNPKYIEKSTGEFSGLCYDILKEIEKNDPDIQFTYPGEFIPFARIENGLETGSIDLFLGMIKNDERVAKFTFIDPPLYPTYNKMVARANDTVKNINGFDDIRKFGSDSIILVDFETAHQKFLESQNNLQIDSQGKNRKENLIKLINGRGRFYYSTDIGLIGTIKDEKLENQVRFLNYVFQEEGQYAAFSKKVSPDVVKRIQNSLNILDKNGTLKKLRAKYVN